jgi:uncharacterized protein (TIGR00269 family)
MGIFCLDLEMLETDSLVQPKRYPVMRCRKCGEKANINMRQHKLALCSTHFLEWLPDQVEHTIRRYHMFSQQDKLLLAVSGGKDSLSLWDILRRLGYSVDGLYISLGIEGEVQYSDLSLEYTRQFASQHNLLLHVIDIKKEHGENIQELAIRTHRGHYKPCSVCGLTKRHIMNRIARQYSYTVLITGHNLDDEAAILFGNTLNWLGPYLLHQAPVLEANMPGLVRKVKPLCRIYEREMAAYALLGGIQYIQDECPFATDSVSIYHKETLDRIESDRPGAKLNFYLSFLRARENGLFSTAADERADMLHTCPGCGQPTSAPGFCAFCRMFVTTGERTDS